MRARLAITCSCSARPAAAGWRAAMRSTISRCSRVDTGSVAALRQRRAAEQVQLVDQAPVGLQQLVVAGQLDHAVVEIEVGGEVGVDVVARCRLLHARRRICRSSRICCGSDRLARACGRRTGRGSRAARRSRRLRWSADLAHEDAAVLLEAHEARFLERAKRLAHRAARHAEPLGDLDLVELRAGAELAGEDHPLELALHQHRQRVLAARVGSRRIRRSAARSAASVGIAGADWARRRRAGRASGLTFAIKRAWV